jgi:hypothetical protein
MKDSFDDEEREREKKSLTKVKKDSGSDSGPMGPVK